MLSEERREMVNDLLFRMLVKRDNIAFAGFFLMPDSEFDYAVELLRGVRHEVRKNVKEMKN